MERYECGNCVFTNEKTWTIDEWFSSNVEELKEILKELGYGLDKTDTDDIKEEFMNDQRIRSACWNGNTLLCRDCLVNELGNVFFGDKW